MRSAAAALLLALTLIACGNAADTADFSAEYRALATEYERRLNELGTDGVESGDVDRETLLGVYAEFRDIAADIRDGYAALDPPPDLHPAVERLVANLDRQVATLDRVVDAAEDDDAERLATHLEDLAALVTDWARMNQEIIERLPD